MALFETRGPAIRVQDFRKIAYIIYQKLFIYLQLK